MPLLCYFQSQYDIQRHSHWGVCEGITPPIDSNSELIPENIRIYLSYMCRIEGALFTPTISAKSLGTLEALLRPFV